MKKKTPFSNIIKKNSVPLSIALLATLLIGFFIFSNGQQYLAGLRQAQSVSAYGSFGSQPLKKYDNRYLTDTTGKPVFLLGYYAWASVTAAGFDHPTKMKDVIEQTSRFGLDYMRIELGMNRWFDRDADGTEYANPAIFSYDMSRGKYYPDAKANLDEFDQSYFAGLDDMIRYANDRKINIHLAMFDGVNIAYGRSEEDSGPGECVPPLVNSFYRWCNSAWNINNQVGNFFGDIDKVPLGGVDFDGDFYQYKMVNGVPTLDSTPGTLNFYQRRYIAEIINRTKQYNNVFYEVGNEMFNTNLPQNREWQQAVVNYAKSIASDRLVTANLPNGYMNNLKNNYGQTNYGTFDMLSQHDGDQATDILSAVEDRRNKGMPIMMDPDGSQLKSAGIRMTRREGGNPVLYEDELRKSAWYAFISQATGWGGFTHDWWDYDVNYDETCNCVRKPGLTDPIERLAETKRESDLGNELAHEIMTVPMYYGNLKKFINESNVEFWNMNPKQFAQDYQNYTNRALEQSGKAIIGFINYGTDVTVSTSNQGNTLLVKYFNPITGQWSAQQQMTNTGSLNLSTPFSNGDPEKRDWAFLIQTEGSTTPTNNLPVGAFISLTSPSANTINITATANDPDSTGPVTIKIYDAGTLLHTSSTNNLNQTLSNISAGTHTIKVTATDLQNGQEVEISGSPKTVSVQNATTSNRLPQGTLGSVTSPNLNTITVVASGIVDPDSTSTPVKINIYDNGTFLKSVTGTSLNETLSNITAGTHSVKVTATDVQTQQEVDLSGSPKSVSVDGPVQTIPLPPAAVTGLKYVCTADGNSVTVSWSPSTYATGYWLRSDRQSDAWTDACPLTSVNGSDLCLGSTVSNAYSQTSYSYSVTPNTNYNLWIHAVSSAGVSQPSSFGFKCAAAVTTAPPTIVPTIAPTLVPTIRPTIVPTLVPTTIPTTKPTVAPTIVPTNPPVTAPPASNSEITIYAAGQPAKGVWPQIGVTVIGEKNGDVINVITQDIRPYTYKPRNNAQVNQLQFNFINDYYEVQKDAYGNVQRVLDRNLRIQKVVQNGQTFNAKDNGTYSYGSWTQANGCSSIGYLNSEWLHCQWGYFRFNQR